MDIQTKEFSFRGGKVVETGEFNCAVSVSTQVINDTAKVLIKLIKIIQDSDIG